MINLQYLNHILSLPVNMDELSEQAHQLHEKMLEVEDSLHNQHSMQKLAHLENTTDLMKLIQELVDRKLCKLIKQNGELMFKAVPQLEAMLVNQMTDDEQMIYSYIEASGREGLWVKALKARTNLHEKVVNKCLKSLEGQKYIKTIQSVQHPTRKIYMLYNLQPALDVIGGPFFTDSELDTGFVEGLGLLIWKFVATRSYPHFFQPDTLANPVQASYPAGYSGFATLDAICEFILNNDVTNVELNSSNIRSLCNLLVYDDKLELANNSFDQYTVPWQSLVESKFGKAFESQNNLSPQDSTTFSIFDYGSKVPVEEEEEDKIYLDAWSHD